MATIVHFELPAADVDRAKGFWSGVFGWTFGGMTEPFVYLMTEGEQPVGAIFQSDEAGSGPIVYMDTSDIDASLAKVGEAGGTAGEKQPIPGTGWFARCKDTEGNSFSLFQGDEGVPGEF
jgi:predicted enzyme related to lactoylglutathione lyase